MMIFLPSFGSDYTLKDNFNLLNVTIICYWMPKYSFRTYIEKIYCFQSISEAKVKALAEYIHRLPLPSNMDALVTEIFGSVDDKRASAFRQSVQYYLNGTASGFLKYCALPCK